MAVDVATSNVTLDPAGRIAQDVPCLHCGYNLRSLLPDQACPECGAAVEPSLRGDALRFSNPRWLSRLSAGMICIVVGGIAFVAAACGALRWLVYWLSSILEIPWPGPNVVVFLILFGLSVLGIWLATSPEPRRAASIRDNRIRIAARVLAVAFLLLMLTGELSPVGTAAKLATLSDYRWLRVRELLCYLLSSAGWVAFCLHISPLGRRAGASRLARFALLVGAGVALLGLVSSGIAAWLSVHVRQWLTSAPNSTFTTLHAINLIALVLQQALLLLAAFPYSRLLRREVRLGRLTMHTPNAERATETL